MQEGQMSKKKFASNDNSTKLLLEHFSEVDLRKWQKLSDARDEYEIKLYYGLEAQRQFNRQKLVSSLNFNEANQVLKKINFCRIIDYKYTNKPFATTGSVLKGGRFNIGKDCKAKPFPAIYIAEDYDTAYAECFGSAKKGLSANELALRKEISFSSIAIELQLENYFDITKAKNLTEFCNIISKFKIPRELETLKIELGMSTAALINSPKMLRDSLIDENWRARPMQFDIPSNSQIFGELVKEAGYCGLLFPSSKKKKKKCLAIFPENFKGTNSYIRIQGDTPEEVEKEVNSKNYQDYLSTEFIDAAIN